MTISFLLQNNILFTKDKKCLVIVWRNFKNIESLFWQRIANCLAGPRTVNFCLKQTTLL